MKVQFVVPGTPVGKGRPKFARRGNFVSTYTPERTASYENLVKVAAHRAMNSLQPFVGAVGSTITLRVIPPASWSKKKRMAAFSGDLRPVGKPDVDNVVKGIFDAMNDIVWLDDKQVVELSVRKEYAERAEAIVEVVEL